MSRGHDPKSFFPSVIIVYLWHIDAYTPGLTELPEIHITVREKHQNSLTEHKIVQIKASREEEDFGMKGELA